MFEDFKKLLDELEPTIGKYIEITANIEEVYPIKTEGMFIDSMVQVKCQNGEVITLNNWYDKYGEEHTDILTFTKCTHGDGDAKYEEMFLDLMEINDIRIEELADEIFYTQHLYVEVTIDRGNILQRDIDYLVEKLEELKELQGEKWTTITI